MIAICERTSIEITLENATNFAVYALLRLFSIIQKVAGSNPYGFEIIFFLSFTAKL